LNIFSGNSNCFEDSCHSQTYHAWLADQHHQLAFERLLAKPDRPRPPQVKLEEDLTDF